MSSEYRSSSADPAGHESRLRAVMDGTLLGSVAALPAPSAPLAVEDTKDESMESVPSSSDRGRSGAPALTDGRTDDPVVLRHDVPGLVRFFETSLGAIMPDKFAPGASRSDGRARTVSPSFEHRGDSSSSSGPREDYKRKFELAQQQLGHFYSKIKEAETAWEHEHADKLNLKSQLDQLQARFDQMSAQLQSVSADLESKRALLQYQHEQHTAQFQQKEFEMKQILDSRMGQVSAESHRFMEETNRFQAIVASKDSEIQSLGHELAILRQQQLPPPGVPQDVVTDLLQERDGALQDLQQELCVAHQEKDVLSQEKDVLSFRVQELEQSLGARSPVASLLRCLPQE